MLFLTLHHCHIVIARVDAAYTMHSLVGVWLEVGQVSPSRFPRVKPRVTTEAFQSCTAGQSLKAITLTVAGTRRCHPARLHRRIRDLVFDNAQQRLFIDISSVIDYRSAWDLRGAQLISAMNKEEFFRYYIY